MRKTISLICALMVAGVCMADVSREILTVTTGANPTSQVSATSAKIRGIIDTVTFDVVTAGATGTLALVATPELSTLSAVTLAAVTDCAADAVIRPRFNVTDASATSYTNDPAYPTEPFVAVGDTFTYSVINGNTSNATFKCVIKYRK